MKALILALALVFPFDAFGISSYSAPASSCKSLQLAIQREARVVLYTKPEIYFLAVRGSEECMGGESFSPVYTKTRDVAQCRFFTCKGK